MKKLLVISVAIAAASLAHAESKVELFGFLDQGVTVLHENANLGMAGPVGQRAPNILNADGKVARNGASTRYMEGTGNVSTWGLKIREDLTPDVAVIAHLEQGFLADDGAEYISGKAFERESSLGISSKTYGTLKMGRMPAMLTGSGTTGLFNSRVNPFGAGWGNMTGGWKFVGTLASARHDNMVNYRSPSFGGFEIHYQYSNGASSETEGTSKTNRYMALGFTYTQPKYFVALAGDWLNVQGAALKEGNWKLKDAYKVLLGGHYKFDSFKLFGTAQYMKNIAYIGGYSTKEFAPILAEQSNKGKVGTNNGFKAWAFSTGTEFKLGAGQVKASVGYSFGENQNTTTNNKFNRINGGLGYVYPLSKRTSIYAITGAFWQHADWQTKNIHSREFIAGLMHRF